MTPHRGSARLRLAYAAAALGVAAAMGGCIGEDDQGDVAPVALSETKEGAGVSREKGEAGSSISARALPAGRFRPPSGYRKTRVADLDPKSLQSAVEEVLSRSRQLRRERGRRPHSKEELEELSVAAVRALASVVLSLLGFDKAEVWVSPNARTVIVAMDPDQACTARPRDQELIIRRIKRQTKQAVRRVKVVVGKVTLRRYVRSSCAGRTQGIGELERDAEQGADETGTGEILWKGTNAGKGRGIILTPPFRTRARTWTIEYEHLGSYFMIFLIKDESPVSVPVNEQGRVAGKAKITVPPGEYRLKIGGSGIWTVRVRDGA